MIWMFVFRFFNSNQLSEKSVWGFSARRFFDFDVKADL
jgi:hypothetical protein